MLFIVSASDEQWNELTGSRTDIEWQRVDETTAFDQHPNADAFFMLKHASILPRFEALKKPVFINSVVQTLAHLHAPVNVYRINGWAGFLKRSAWEICGSVRSVDKPVFNALQIKFSFVKDEPGFITARIIAMIINEAYFAMEDNVSSKAEIDMAMKLGTNYPYGPFEWCARIGIKHVYELLEAVYEDTHDERYKICSLMKKEYLLH